jgi:hypothetical protein
MAYGTLTLADLQATALNATVAEVGLDRTFEGVTNTLAAHNRIMGELFSELADRTTDRLRRYGTTDTMTMEDADEFTVPRAQKVTAGTNVGFPLYSAMGGLQWTEMYFRKKTIGEFAAQIDAMMEADARRVTRDLKRAIFYSSNATVTDRFVDGISLAVKRLVNADSADIPVGPNGETFTAASHTHYIARVGALAESDFDSLVTTVKEHFDSGRVLVYINQAQEAAVRAFTNFVGYPDPRLIFSDSTTRADRSTLLDQIQIYNRAIGIMGSNGAEVVVKPWVPANYAFAFNPDQPKPLAYRYDPDYGDGLQLVLATGTGEIVTPDYPWQARGYRRMFGFGAWTRVNGAVLYTGNTSYADPTLA